MPGPFADFLGTTFHSIQERQAELKAAEELQLAEERQRIKAEKAAAKARKVAEQKDRGTGMGRWEEEDGAGRVFSNSDIFHGMVFYKRKIHCPRRYEMEVLILKRTRKDCPAKFVSLGWGGMDLGWDLQECGIGSVLRRMLG